jgi:tetratricopeptide (TPR) repeat protein
MAAVRLGELLEKQGNVAGARVAFQRALDSGHTEAAPKAAVSLGELLEKQGDVAGALAAFQWALDSGHVTWAPQAANSLKRIKRSPKKWFNLW